MHALQKFSKKVNKALGGNGGGNRRRTIAESTGLDTEDSHHEESVDGLHDSQAIKPSSSSSPEEHKGFVHNVSSGMENFIRSITDKPKPLPVRTTLPEDEADDEGHDIRQQNGVGGGGDAYALKNEPQELDENTPVNVLLARIEFLEVSLRNETERGNLLEEQVGMLEDKLYQMERIGHRSILSSITRPFRMCFGLDRQPIAPQVSANTFSGY